MAVIEATMESFDTLIRDEYVMVDFYGEHCGACKFTAPFLREAADDMAFIKFVKVNTSVYPKLAELFNIKALPTFLYFRNGQVVHKSVGGMELKNIREQIAVMLYKED